MDRTYAEKTLRAAPVMLADDDLLAVAGGHKHHHHGGSDTSQSNSVGNITVNAPNNSGTIIIEVTQTNDSSGHGHC